MRKNGSDDPWTRAFNGVLFLMFLIFECWHLAKLMYRKFCPLKVLKVTLTENWPRTPSSQVGVCFGAFDFSCPAPLPDACWMGQRNCEGCSCLLVLPCAKSHWWSHRPSQDKSWSETLYVYQASLQRDTTKKQSYDLASGKWITRTCARQLELATASFLSRMLHLVLFLLSFVEDGQAFSLTAQSLSSAEKECPLQVWNCFPNLDFWCTPQSFRRIPEVSAPTHGILRHGPRGTTLFCGKQHALRETSFEGRPPFLPVKRALRQMLQSLERVF